MIFPGFFSATHLREVGVEPWDSSHIVILCGQYTGEFLLVFRDVLERTVFFSFLCFFSSLCLRFINFSILVTTLTFRVLLLRLLLRLCRLDPDPEDDPDDDVSVSESEFGDELESEEELSVAKLDNEFESRIG